MILYRCFAWDQHSRNNQTDGPLWFPRVFQGEGRHDNPDIYGCMYLTDRPVSAVVEQLARFRTQRLTPFLLQRRGLPLALAEIELSDAAEIINLDDPSVLARESLRPAVVATRRREVTQPQARRLHEQHPNAAALSWWSSYEALWTNVTVFERAGTMLRVRFTRVLKVADPAVVEAADFFELRTA